MADLLEEPAARVEDLALLVVGYVAVLADGEHAIDGERLAAEREAVGDGVVDLEAVLLRQVAAHVGLRHLIGVERHEFQAAASLPSG